MIEFFSNSDWLNPQVDFLLMLQTIRTEHFAFLDKAFLSVTILGEMWLPVLICSIIYWCIDFRAGVYLFSLFGFELIFAQFFKMLACVYRPWVLSDKIHPVEQAIAAAKGYSFPSGHSATASSVLGGLAYLYRKHKIWCCLLILTVLCVGFSRMWLGVHTPQDVVVGLTMGLILVFWVNSLINWAEEDKNRYLYLLIIVDILTALALIFVCYFNKYPLDYFDGKILVDPKHSIYTCINCMGNALGMINGAFLCRRFTNFDAKNGSFKSKCLKGFIGVIFVFLLVKFVGGYVFANELNYKLALLITFFIGMFITLIYPYITMIVFKNK